MISCLSCRFLAHIARCLQPPPRVCCTFLADYMILLLVASYAFMLIFCTDCSLKAIACIVSSKLCELLLLTCNACLIFLARLPALLSVIKNLGRICKSCGQYFGHFDHSDWHVLDGWLARLKCVWLESVKEQYWTPGRNARQVQGSFLVNSKYWHLNSRYHQSPLCWKISTLYSLLSKSHKKITSYSLHPVSIHLNSEPCTQYAILKRFQIDRFYKWWGIQYCLCCTVAFAADGWWLNLGRPPPRQGVACGGLAQCSPADGWLDWADPLRHPGKVSCSPYLAC